MKGLETLLRLPGSQKVFCNGKLQNKNSDSKKKKKKKILLHILKTVYASKVVLGMIDQCHSETDIVNYILPYIIVINLKIFQAFSQFWLIACIHCVNMPITIASLSNFDFFDVCKKQCKTKQS